MKQRNVLIALAVVVTLLPLSAQAEKGRAGKGDITNKCLVHLENGTAYIQTGRADLAIEEYQKALRLNPNLAVMESRIGFAQMSKNNWQEAEQSFKRALDIEPEYGNANYGMMLISAQKKDIDQAISYLEKSIKYGPALSERYLQLGVFRITKQDTDGALAAWQEALKINENDVQVLSNLGGLLVMQGRVDEGMGQIQRALKLAPNFAQAHNNLGIAFMQGKKDYAGAEKEFRRAIELAPNYADANQNLGQSLFLQKRYDDATAAFNVVVKAQPKSARPYYYLAAINSINRRNNDALDQLGKAVSLDANLKKNAQNEPSFENIKGLEGFKKLVS